MPKKTNNMQMILSTAILLIATIYFIAKKNYEFLVYAGTLIILIYLIYRTDRLFHYLEPAKWAFLIWMILHMAGGSLYINGTRLYDLILAPIVGDPYNILKYDQFVHFFCYVAITLLFYSVLKTIVKKGSNRFTVALTLVLAASSIGAINEIIEFSTVVFFASNGVGGYYNTLIDICANLVGSIVAALFLWKKKLI
jgi:hypothetical protein